MFRITHTKLKTIRLWKQGCIFTTAYILKSNNNHGKGKTREGIYRIYRHVETSKFKVKLYHIYINTLNKSYHSKTIKIYFILGTCRINVHTKWS